MKKYIYLLVITFVMAEVSCDVEPTNNVGVSSINLNETVFNLNVGETATLVATVKPENANDKVIIWSSDNESVATVDDNGVITAKGKGVANIKGISKSYPNISAICVVNVSKVLISLNIIKNLTLFTNSSITINTNVSPKDASDTTVTWTSSNETLATVSSKGVINSKNVQGTAYITATSKSNTKLFEVCTLNITKPLTTLGLMASLTIENLETYPLVTNVLPKDATDTSVFWSSSNPDIATVNAISGLLTAKSAGTAKIRATSKVNSTFYQEFDLTVINITVKSISLPATLDVGKGGNKTLTVTFTPNNAFNKDITWSSSDNTKATVVNGVVTGKAEGTVTITATSNNNKIAVCTVNVIFVAELLSFKFEKTNNPAMVASSTELTKYNETNYGGTFKYIANNKLVPTFTTSTGATVTVNGETQTSGTSVQDFTSPVYYTVNSQDGSVSQTFRVYLNFENDTLEVKQDTLKCKPGYYENIITAILSDSMNGFKIRVIRKYGFFTLLTNLSNVSFPNTLEVIEKAAFSNIKIKQIILPKSLKLIEEDAFFGCSNLTGDLVIPNSVITIETNSFNNCRKLDGILTLSNNLKEIGNNAFENCNFKGKLVLPESLISIGNGAFKGNSGFTGNIVIPNSVTNIGNNVFSGCTGLTGTLTIGTGLTNIPGYAFPDIKITGTLIIPNNVTSIGEYAFSNCIGFTGSLNIPNNVKSIGGNAFENCSGFNGSLTIGTGLSKISPSTFTGTTFTGELIIPENVTSIYDFAFSNCLNLTKISYKSGITVSNNAFDGTSATITTYN